MKRSFRAMAFALVLFSITPITAEATQTLIPVGKVIGLQLQNDTVTVAAFDEECPAARDAGIKIGDELVKIDGRAILSTEDVRSAMRSCNSQIELTIRRNGKLSTLHMTPASDTEGPRLGLFLRQGIAGIGTVTFYDPETGYFGTLGHGVNDNRGNLLSMKQGFAYEAQINSVRKGRSGEPGQLKGSADDMHTVGTILKNTPQGVFGKASHPWYGQPVPVAAYREIQTGNASIRCCIAGDHVQEYSVEILKIYPENRNDGRNFLIKVTDSALLSATGGIVQGMSGSPILQDGKLVGAVTHVLVNDPTRGYGIFIKNMLDAAES